MLKFSPANVKIQALSQVPALAPFLANKRKVYSFDLLSGWACPHAHDCLSKVILENGKRTIRDGKHTKFRCFSASQEALFPAVYNLRKANYDALKAAREPAAMAALIEAALPKNAGIIRIHVGGDFFSQAYFNAWCMVAYGNQDKIFYTYTKSLPYWVKNIGAISDNFVLTASRGGRCDNLISAHNLRESVVVYSEAEAAKLGLEIDHTDEHAADYTRRSQSFALLIHGTQPKGSEAGKAISALKKGGAKFSYSRKKSINTVA